jgi:hypothetical protein
MTQTLTNGKSGIRWTLTSTLEDLDYADDITLLSSRQSDMQEKVDKITNTSLQNCFENQRKRKLSSRGKTTRHTH